MFVRDKSSKPPPAFLISTKELKMTYTQSFYNWYLVRIQMRGADYAIYYFEIAFMILNIWTRVLSQ